MEDLRIFFIFVSFSKQEKRRNKNGEKWKRNLNENSYRGHILHTHRCALCSGSHWSDASSFVWMAKKTTQCVTLEETICSLSLSLWHSNKTRKIKRNESHHHIHMQRIRIYVTAQQNVSHPDCLHSTAAFVMLHSTCIFRSLRLRFGLISLNFLDFFLHRREQRLWPFNSCGCMCISRGTTASPRQTMKMMMVTTVWIHFDSNEMNRFPLRNSKQTNGTEATSLDGKCLSMSINHQFYN